MCGNTYLLFVSQVALGDICLFYDGLCLEGGSEMTSDVVEYCAEGQCGVTGLFCILEEMLTPLFHCGAPIWGGSPHSHILFDLLPRVSTMVIFINQGTITNVSPLFFIFLAEATRMFDTVEYIVAGASMPLLVMTQHGNMHLPILP
jgi:hypothetical protein